MPKQSVEQQQQQQQQQYNPGQIHCVLLRQATAHTLQGHVNQCAPSLPQTPGGKAAIVPTARRLWRPHTACLMQGCAKTVLLAAQQGQTLEAHSQLPHSWSQPVDVTDTILWLLNCTED
jgi:hypothetical protein